MHRAEQFKVSLFMFVIVETQARFKGTAFYLLLRKLNNESENLRRRFIKAINSGHINEIYIFIHIYRYIDWFVTQRSFAWNKCGEPYAFHSYAYVCRYLKFNRNMKKAASNHMFSCAVAEALWLCACFFLWWLCAFVRMYFNLKVKNVVKSPLFPLFIEA